MLKQQALASVQWNVSGFLSLLEMKHKILHENIKKRELEIIILQKMGKENVCLATRYLSRNR